MIIYLTIIKTTTTIEKITSFGMWLYAKLRFLPTHKTYGHMEIRFGEFTVGSTGKGVTVNLWEAYLKEHVVNYKSFPIELDEEGVVIFYNYLKKMEDKRYEYINFLWHFIKIFTGVWFGNKTPRKVYCYEYGLSLLSELGYDVDVFMNPYECEGWLINNYNNKWK